MNGLGYFLEEPPRATYSEFVYRDGRVAEIVEKDRNGVVRRRNVVADTLRSIRWLDAMGRPQIEETDAYYPAGYNAMGVHRRFDALGRSVSTRYVDGRGRSTSSTGGYYSETRTERDARGAITAESYFDFTGRPMRGSEGAHRIVHTVNAQGLPILDEFFDEAGKPATRSGRKRTIMPAGTYLEAARRDPRFADDVHAIRRRYDDVGNLLQCVYLGLDGKAVRSQKEGAASYRVERDAHGAEVARTYFDEAGEPVIGANGYATRRTRRNSVGIAVEERFFGADGKPAKLPGLEYSIVRRAIDERGRVVLESYFDADDRPFTVPDGYQRVESFYDERDHVTLLKYEDERGIVSNTRHGFAMQRRDYDVDRLTRWRYLDANDQPVDPTYERPEPEMYHQYRVIYDEQGDIKSNWYGGVGSLDESEQPNPEPNCTPEVDRPVVDQTTRILVAQLSRPHHPEHAYIEIVRRVLGTVENRATACSHALAAAIGAAVDAEIVRVTTRTRDKFCVELRAPARQYGKWIVQAGPGISDANVSCPTALPVYVLEETPEGIAFFLKFDFGTTYTDGGFASTWHDVTFTAFEPGPSLEKPRAALTERVSAWWDDDSSVDFERYEDRVAIRFRSWDDLSGNVARDHVRFYRRESRRVRRVQPFVTRSRDMPDEWIRLPWSEASKLCAPGKQAELKPWHALIKRAIDGETPDQLKFEGENSESESDYPWQAFGCARCKELPAHIYFHLRREGEGFLVDAISAGS